MERSTNSSAAARGAPGGPPPVPAEEGAPENTLDQGPFAEIGDYQGMRRLWQEKLDEALARKEQEEYTAELRRVRSSERENEKATIELLRSEGYFETERGVELLDGLMKTHQEEDRQAAAGYSFVAVGAAPIGLGFQGHVPSTSSARTDVVSTAAGRSEKPKKTKSAASQKTSTAAASAKPTDKGDKEERPSFVKRLFSRGSKQ